MTNSKYTLDSHEYFRFMDLELENLTLRLKLHEMKKYFAKISKWAKKS